MERTRSARFGAPLFGLALLAGCVAAPGSDDDLEVVPDGKADNYFSTTAQEYYVDGLGKLVLEDSYSTQSASERLARAQQLMALKNIEIGWFLHVRLIDKEEGAPPHGDPNASSYPGFHAMVRDGGYSDSALTPQSDGLTYTFKVRLQVAGQKKLIDALPGTMVDSTHKRFTLQMGKVPNDELARLDAEHEWFRGSQWSSGTFDPTKLSPDQLEPLELTIYPQPTSSDAYLDTNALFSDGKLSIDVHYGWDYWSRYDIQLSQELYEKLVGDGFASPAASYDKYTADLGPLTKTIDANGKPVEVQVRIYHGLQPNVAPGPDPDTDQGGIQMEKDMYASLAHSDVVVFAGHSGNYYGFALANWNLTSRGALDYPELRTAMMPSDHYQIVLASGCDTFSIGQAFRDNPNKPGLKNLDVITTTTFSNAGSNAELDALFDALYSKQNSARRFDPESYGALLGAMNGTWDIGAMYGVHGIDDNPRLHPFANVATLGQSCSSSAQCGGDGNRCTRVSSSKRVCSATCLDDSGCPSGYRCKQVANSSTATIVGRQCLR